MTTRIVLGALLAAAVMFVWGFVFWVVLPGVRMASDPFPDDGVAVALKETLPSSGVYMYPFPVDMNDEVAMKVHREKHLAGPIFFIHFIREGSEPMLPMTFVWGGIHYFVTALLAAILLAWTCGRESNFGSRLMFVFLLGLFSTVWIDANAGIWFHQPWEWCLLLAAYSLSSCLLMGIVLAAIVKRPAME